MNYSKIHWISSPALPNSTRYYMLCSLNDAHLLHLSLLQCWCFVAELGGFTKPLGRLRRKSA
eukprot:2456-Heterococcus_DN1.PRE.2